MSPNCLRLSPVVPDGLAPFCHPLESRRGDSRHHPSPATYRHSSAPKYLIHESGHVGFALLSTWSAKWPRNYVQPAAKNLRRALKFAINRSARHPNANVNVIVDGKKTSACMTLNTERLTPNITARGRLPIWATGRSIVKIILTTQIAIDRFSGRGMPRSEN